MAQTSEEYINEMYDKQKANTLQGLESAYNKNVSTLDEQAAKIPQDYYEQKREVEGNANVQQKNMNEIFAANGLNTGAVGQAALAMSNQKAANLATLNKGQADAESALALQRTQLENDYKSEVQQAIQESDYNRAQALYSAYQTQQSEAKNQVDAMLKLGVLPSSDLIAKSGYSAEYVNGLYNAYRNSASSSSSGYTYDTSDDADDGGLDGGGSSPTAADFGKLTSQLTAKNTKNATSSSSWKNATLSSTEKQDYLSAYKNGDITYQQYINLMNAARNRK